MASCACAPDLVAERLVALQVDAAGVDHDELAADPLGLAFLAVAGDPRLGGHHRVAGAGDAVEEGGFAHVGIADDGHPGLRC